MMALTLAYDGREVGRFFVLPDRSDSGKTTRNLALCYFLGGEDTSGRGAMSGTFHSEWLCDDKALGYEGHHVVHCRLTLTPELSTKPILNDVFKRISTNVCQKLRKPHSDHVFDESFGTCVHFLETNYTPGMLYSIGDLCSLVDRSMCIISSRKRAFTRHRSEAGEKEGVFLMETPEEVRRAALAPSTRRASSRYWVDFTKDCPIEKCAQMLGNLDLLGQEFGSTLRRDAEEFRRSMLSREDEGNRADAQSTIARETDDSDSYDILRKVHMMTMGYSTHVNTYVIRSLPNDVLEGLKAETSLGNKPTKIDNFKTAVSNCNQGNFMELFRPGSTPGQFLRTDVDLEKLESLAGDSSVFGRICDWGDVLSVRYEKCFPVSENKATMVEGAPSDPVIIREVFDIDGLNQYWGVCSDKHKPAFSDLIGKAVALPGSKSTGAHAVPYSNTNAYGRKYARGPSLQKIGRDGGGDYVLRKVGVGVDMVNCHPSLMRILLRKTHTSDGEDGDYVKKELSDDDAIRWQLYEVGNLLYGVLRCRPRDGEELHTQDLLRRRMPEWRCPFPARFESCSRKGDQVSNLSSVLREIWIVLLSSPIPSSLAPFCDT